MGKPINIAVSCNERYVSGALVALSGVAVYARPETELRFHLFTEDVRKESVDFVKSTLRRLHPRSELVQHECSESILTGLPCWAGSRMAAVRCHYATLMPDVDRCLYLDCDVLYLSSVEEHFTYCDDSVLACVVQEESAVTRRDECEWIRHVCGIEVADAEYFNSGVILFNLKNMRADGIPERLMRFFREHPDVPSPDQDALNATLVGRTRLCPPKFNRLQIFLTDEKLMESPVVHYVCGNPWLPKYGVVANERFHLWHAFADRYIWQESGESYRRNFSIGMLRTKRLFWRLLKTPVVGAVFARFMQSIGMTSDGEAWRRSQVGNDISQGFVEDLFK